MNLTNFLELKNLRLIEREHHFAQKIQVKNQEIKNEDIFNEDFHCIIFENIDFSGTKFDNCNFSAATFKNCSMNGAFFSNCDLNSASLTYCDLSNSKFVFCNLENTNFCGSDLRNSDLMFFNCNLKDVDFVGVKNMPFIPHVCPKDGSFIAYKKVKDNYIIKLLIPDDAKRSSGTTRKCRCDKALVLEIQNLDGTLANVNSVESIKDKKCVYTVGEVVFSEKEDKKGRKKYFDGNRFNDCTYGIHFFMNREEAVKWVK